MHKIQKICERIPDWNTSPTGALGTIDGRGLHSSTSQLNLSYFLH